VVIGGDKVRQFKKLHYLMSPRSPAQKESSLSGNRVSKGGSLTRKKSPTRKWGKSRKRGWKGGVTQIHYSGEKRHAETGSRRRGGRAGGKEWSSKAMVGGGRGCLLLKRGVESINH